jgi:hypothetical protein
VRPLSLTLRGWSREVENNCRSLARLRRLRQQLETLRVLVDLCRRRVGG